MAAPIRVLHVFGRLGLGGAESRIMDLYRHMDRTKVQFDFLVHTDATVNGTKCPTSEQLMAVREPDYFDEDVKKLGGRIYALPRFNGTNSSAYKKAVEQFFDKHKMEWNVVQGHMTSTAAIYLPIAKKVGRIPITAAHVRSAGTDPGIKGLATDFLRGPLKKKGTADYLFACTEEAGRRVYGNKLVDNGGVYVIHNAIDVSRFAFDPEMRSQLRGELGLDNAIIIGHVGSFRYAKNHEFLLRVYSALSQMVAMDEDGEYAMLKGMPLRLMLLGDGPLRPEMEDLARRLHISDEVLFMGNKSNIKDYYQVMDYFVFPSHYEGLPGTVVEAQTSGLQCLISDTISKEVCITDLVEQKNIKEKPEIWAKKILKDLMEPNLLAGNRDSSQRKLIHLATKAGYDVNQQAREMTYFYLNGQFKPAINEEMQ